MPANRLSELDRPCLCARAACRFHGGWRQLRGCPACRTAYRARGRAGCAPRQSAAWACVRPRRCAAAIPAGQRRSCNRRRPHRPFHTAGARTQTGIGSIARTARRCAQGPSAFPGKCPSAQAAHGHSIPWRAGRNPDGSAFRSADSAFPWLSAPPSVRSVPARTCALMRPARPAAWCRGR